LDNGEVPGLPKALALDLGLDHEALTQDPAAPAPAGLDRLRAALTDFPLNGPHLTCGDVTEALGALARRLIPDGDAPPALGRTRTTLRFLRETVRPRLELCRQEIDHVLAALDGRFVPPGPSGAPTRGTADVLPTGRNFYSLDIRAVPTPTAWRVGSATAAALLERHRERAGSYPESVALVVWGTSN